MDRLACADLAALPLQLLQARHPQWAGHPTVVVAEDRPQGIILTTNEAARRHAIATGMRYAQGLSLCDGLRAGVVEEAEIQAAVERVTRRLQDFSPEVQPSSSEPGVFWLNVGGLGRLVPSLTHWGLGLVRALGEQQLEATVVIGFSRFGTYALARHRGPGDAGVLVCDTTDEELALARAVPLSVLDLEPTLRGTPVLASSGGSGVKLRRALEQLGVRTAEDFLRLPRQGLLERFGAAAHRLHDLASGTLWDPLVGQPHHEPVEQVVDLEFPEGDLTRLMFSLKRALDPLLARLAARGEKLAALSLELLLADGRRLRHQLRPALPTLEVVQILELVRLRLEAHELEAHIDGFRLEAEPAAVPAHQLQLFAQTPRRDLEAANQALARVRAELGPAAVTRAVLQDRHLPEARFELQPLARLGPARPIPGDAPRRLVRRLATAAEATVAPDASRGGPHMVSGGWWQREVCREYHFTGDRRGRLTWIFHDHERGRWMLQGTVE